MIAKLIFINIYFHMLCLVHIYIITKSPSRKSDILSEYQNVHYCTVTIMILYK